MRNLSLIASTLVNVPNTNFSATTVDVDQNILYVASEAPNLDGEAEIEIWKVEMDSAEQFPPSVLTMFTAVLSTVSNLLSSQIVSFRFLAETRRLSVILCGGDITIISLDEEEPTAEVEGIIDSGVLASSWSPDDSLLVLITGQFKLVLMTSTFDVLSDVPLHTTDFGEDAPINVGWGSKQTQFHGSLGKGAAQETSSARVGCSPDDDTFPRVSWRGDGSLFVVSSLSPPDSNGTCRRILRVYDRQASLQSTSELVAGLEHPLAWRPSGNLIVSTQRFGFEGGGTGIEGRHDVVFFEKNGLRHGQFGIRSNEFGDPTPVGVKNSYKGGYKVRELSWSSDSNVLSLWIERDEGDIVQLWTTGNYHWYLKQEIVASTYSNMINSGHFTSVSWHPEIPIHLILTTSSQVIHRTYAWQCFVSSTKPPRDSGSVAVFDGSTILLTPFRTQNIPPPMSSFQLSLPMPLDTPYATDRSHSLRTPIHLSFSSRDDIAVLWESGYVEIWNLHTRFGPGRDKIMAPTRIWGGFINDDDSQHFRQIKLWTGETQNNEPFIVRMVALGTSRDGHDVLTITGLREGVSTGIDKIRLPKRNGRLVESDENISWQGCDGELYDVKVKDSKISPVARFPEFCLSSNHISMYSPALIIYIGLGASGKLYLTSNFKVAHSLVSHATSFTITSGFVIFTTNSHEVVFAPLASLATILSIPEDGDVKNIVSGWEKRRIERGSRIVTVVPSTMSLILQMPRGNLETINPRALVMEVVKQDLDGGSYRKAFLACRKHRIDLNVIVDHNQVAFMERLASFVDQVDDVDHINLFLTSLGRGSQPREVIARLCDALRIQLEARNLTKYVNSILTAYVVKSPPDHEAGLALLLRLRDTDPHLVEDAVRYIIFLVDADRLFDTALGMYDFSLVLMIAQHAQKDPREYLPFLRELRALEKYYQRFRIDDYLKRHEKALRNLSLAEMDHFEEAMAYVERHQLYEPAMSIWKGTDRYSSVLDIYGDWLFEKRDLKQAALVYIEAKRPLKAMVAYEKALEWRALFELAIRENHPKEDIASMGYRIAEDLSSKRRYSESARVLLDYSNDVREAVIALVQGNHFSEARRIVTLHGVEGMLVDIIYPGSLESQAQLVEDMNEMREQVRKQLHRLRELRIKKIEEPNIFYGVDDGNLHNVDIMTDVSVPATAFTRYTAAPSAASKTSKRSSRSKRKMQLKAESGRKGTVHEEEYLLKSVAKLVDRFNNMIGEAGNLLPHLLQFTAEHRREGRSLQNGLDKFERELKEALDEIWKEPVEEHDAVLTGTGMARMQGKDKELSINATVVKVPEVTGHAWRMRLFDIDQPSDGA